MLPFPSIDLAFHNAVPQTAFGISMIGLVLTINGFAFTAIISFFRSGAGQRPHPSKARSTFSFTWAASSTMSMVSSLNSFLDTTKHSTF